MIVVFWNGMELIGLAIGGLLVLLILAAMFWDWIKEKFKR